MGFFSRIYNLWRGFLSLFVGNLEEQNPEIVYENAINAMVEKHAELKTAAAGLIKNRSKLEAKIERLETELDATQLELDGAIEMENDEIALILLEKQDQLKDQFATAQNDLLQAEKDAEVVKEELNNHRAEIEKLKRERDDTLAQIKSAEARKQIQESLDGLSVDEELQALDKVREYRDRVKAEVQVNDELAESSIEGKLAEVRKEGAKSRARARLEKLKAERRGEAQPAAVETEVETPTAGDDSSPDPGKTL